MTSRKSQNSILVLATLGVYFGLVLAGATPQVLSQAAMTREFSVKDEVEVTDKLDKKPDDERSPLTDSVQVYLEDVEYFLKSLARSRSRGTFDLGSDTFDVAQSTLLPCIDSNLAGRYDPHKFIAANRDLVPLLTGLSRKLVYGFSLGDCIPNDDFKTSAVDTKFNFHLDADELLINVAIRKHSPAAADHIARELGSTFDLYRTSAATPLRKQVIERTKIHTDISHLFVVTRLPRADLDSLLGTDAR